MAMQQDQSQQAPNVFERRARTSPPAEQSAPQPTPATLPAQTAQVSGADNATLASMLFGDEQRQRSMPAEVVEYMRQNNWGPAHLQWHSERRWDALSPETAQANGWQRAAIQEGEQGNGLEFLAMHRGMMQMLREQFPQHEAMFSSASVPPLQGDGPMHPDMQRAFETLQNLDQHVNEFQSDDDFGMFIQSAAAPSHAAKLGSPGIHNYLHTRLSDPTSPIDMGNPTVNIENPLFWQLHGWIDNRWDEFRRLRGERADQPEYVEAMKNGMASMHHGETTHHHHR